MPSVHPTIRGAGSSGGRLREERAARTLLDVSHPLAFVALSAVVIVTPGPDTALIVRNTLFGGRRNGVRTAAGIVSGITVWTLAAAAGVAAVVAAPHPLFVALRIVGAAYLVWLGIASLRAALRREQPPHRAAGGAAGGYRQGLLSNLGNPKIAVFFTSLLPQFGSGFFALAALGLLFCVMGAVWLTGYAVAVSRAKEAILRPRLRRALDALTGLALVAFGARLATE
jgi:threonine/homoserine/homoserine lactone efflux protein